MTEETHEEYLTRQDALAAEQANHSVAWDRARATFWQALGGSAVFTVTFSQTSTWGDLAAQGVALAIAAAGSIASAALAGAASYARWRGGTPKNTH